MLNMPSASEGSDLDDAPPSSPPTTKHVNSPVMKRKKTPSMDEDAQPLDTTLIESTPLRRSPRKSIHHSTVSLDDMQQSGSSNTIPISKKNTTMSRSTCFQYAVLMELKSLKETQAGILEKLQMFEEEGNGTGSTRNIEELIKLSTIEAFVEEERKLGDKSYIKGKKLQLKSIGGKDTRNNVKNILDAMMTRELQDKFSKNGLKGKRAFVKTQHYKCLLGAIVDPVKDGFTKSAVDFYVSDLLKRAVRNKAAIRVDNNDRTEEQDEEEDDI